MLIASRPVLFAKILIVFIVVFLNSCGNNSTGTSTTFPVCDTPSSNAAGDTSAAQVLYWGLNNTANCGTSGGLDALPITFPFELDASAATPANFSFWNAATASWAPVTCAQWGPTSGVAPELTTVTLFMTPDLTPSAGDTLQVCHAALPKNDGGTTPQGYITSQGWCDNTGSVVDDQGIGFVNAFDNGNNGVCTSPTTGIMLTFSGGARNSSNNRWSLSDIQSQLRVYVDGDSNALAPSNLGDSDRPVPDNFYEICVTYPDGKSFSNVTKIEMDTATAYDPHVCPNGGMKFWEP
ncbi:MAG: hypothetical protein COA42_24490 [Alteromonadaceae bacterium]|nr:MAG: hypothetical protein COA42_24490 [Alteromonadaceae bacterium]